MKTIVPVIFIVMTFFPAFGSGFANDADISFCASIVIPNNLFQTGLCADINPLGVSFSDFCLTTGLSYFKAFDGFVKSSVYLRNFNSVGPDVKLSYSLSDRIGFWLRGRMMFGFMDPFNVRFVYFDVEGGAGFDLVKTPSMDLSVIMPVCVGLRKDVTEIRSGVGLSVRIL